MTDPQRGGWGKDDFYTLTHTQPCLLIDKVSAYFVGVLHLEGILICNQRDIAYFYNITSIQKAPKMSKKSHTLFNVHMNAVTFWSETTSLGYR